MHSAYAWSGLAAEIMSASYPERVWLAHCQHANYTIDEIDDAIGLSWRTSRQLTSWLELAGIPV